MAHTCSECTYLDFNKEYEPGDGRFWCETKYEWHFANEAECWRYCPAYSRSNLVADSYRKYSQEKSEYQSSCFITTIVCETLGFKDTTKVLNSLRKFRNDIMQKDKKYLPILAEYDIIGPIIASKIRNDKEKEILAVALFNSTLIKVSNFIENNEYLSAIILYKEMTEGLIEYYNINRKVSLEELNSIDINKSGHGKVYKLATQI